MKQKTKVESKKNNKFNFDDEYIIGISAPIPQQKQKKSTKKNNKRKQGKSNKQKKRPQMNEKNKKIRKILIKTFLIMCLFVGAGCFLCLSPMFNTEEIIVENNDLIPSDTIISLSKIELYKNIFLINKSKTIKNIEENPYVSSVKISRVLPNKVKIIVEERIEKYVLQFAEGKFAIIDSQGYILGITSENKNLPIILGTETNIEDLIQVTNNENRLCNADLKKLDMINMILEISKNYEVDSFITQIDITEANDIKLILTGEGKTVYLGNCSDLNTRILYMKDILNKEKGMSGKIFINGNLSEDHVYFAPSAQ